MNEPGDVCMVYDDRGNAFDCFDYEPDELEAHALAIRKARGELSTVTINPSPFLLAQPGDEHTPT